MIGITRFLLVGTALLVTPVQTPAKDVFLVIGGGPAPSGNQASLEKNVLYFQRLLQERQLDHLPRYVFFADGTAPARDLQVIDQNSVPKANQLMAEFFGSETDLGLSYRNHEVPDVRGSTNPANIRQWFANSSRVMDAGDRLVLYVTAHGNGSDERRGEYDTTISMWGDASLRMTEFVRLLDRLPEGVEVVAIMVQCYSGGFARFIFNDGDPRKGVSRQRRSGFFATVHDRPAAGCTPEVDEATYVEYSTYFWNALAGHDRSGDAIDPPDYDGDGRVSFDEAHAYTVLTAETIDLPIKTSGEYLSIHSEFGDENSELLTNEEPYDAILDLATPAERAILEGLSQQLELTGRDRVVTAWRESQPRRGSGRGTESRFARGRRGQNPSVALRRKIAADVKRRWPELANVLNPVAIDLLTTRSEEFVAAIEDHPDFQQYRESADESAARPDEQARLVKYERFLRTADNVILAENLRRRGNPQKIAEYELIVEAERQTLPSLADESTRGPHSGP